MADVFISYAHVDDQPLPPASAGWVSTFVEGIKAYLAMKLGRSEAFSLWMDDKLQGNLGVTEAIHTELSRTSSLVLFLSPGYLASD